MNKRGIGLGPAIAVSVIALAIFLVGTNALIGYGKVNVVNIAKTNADDLEINELLLGLLNEKVENLNLADLIVLGEFDKVGDMLKEKLSDVSFNFRVYKDFKNIMQSKPVYSLGDAEGVIAMHKIKNYFGEDLVVYLSVK